MHILTYSKTYEFDLRRQVTITEDYRLYNGVEWRNIPKSNERGATTNWITKEELDLKREYFYTVVKSPALVDLLFTKIMTIQQTSEDFWYTRLRRIKQ